MTTRKPYKHTTPLCSCGRWHINMGNRACWECRTEQERRRLLSSRPPCAGCGLRRPIKGREKCSNCRDWLPCALCGRLSKGDLCNPCWGLTQRDDRKRRVAVRLRKKGLTFREIGEQLGGVSRQRAEQMCRWSKSYARGKLQSALASGNIIKPPFCQRCENETTSLHAHHADYNQPLEVRWLCVPCHNIVHPHPGYNHNRGPRRNREART